LVESVVTCWKESIEIGGVIVGENSTGMLSCPWLNMNERRSVVVLISFIDVCFLTKITKFI
jgi:hypothetical protein